MPWSEIWISLRVSPVPLEWVERNWLSAALCKACSYCHIQVSVVMAELELCSADAPDLWLRRVWAIFPLSCCAVAWHIHALYGVWKRIIKAWIDKCETWLPLLVIIWCSFAVTVYPSFAGEVRHSCVYDYFFGRTVLDLVRYSKIQSTVRLWSRFNLVWIPTKSIQKVHRSISAGNLP